MGPRNIASEACQTFFTLLDVVLMWLFRRRVTADRLLLDRFLQLETDRLAHRSDLEAKREELEVKKLEIELTHLEARTKAQISLDAARQELLLKRREAGRLGQRKRRANREAAAAAVCTNPLCIDKNHRPVTMEMVREFNQHEASGLHGSQREHEVPLAN